MGRLRRLRVQKMPCVSDRYENTTTRSGFVAGATRRLSRLSSPRSITPPACTMPIRVKSRSSTAALPLPGWRVESQNSREIWRVEIPEVKSGDWYFRELFVNRKPRSRARYPKTNVENPEWLWIESLPDWNFGDNWQLGQHRFIAKPGEMQTWSNLNDVEIVALHFWVEDRLPIQSYDPETREVTFEYRSIFALSNDFDKSYSKYYVDNVAEALTDPGEWYLDRISGVLSYIPIEGERPESTLVIAPRLTQLMLFKADQMANGHALVRIAVRWPNI